MLTPTKDLTGPALDWAVWTCAGGAAAYPKTASGKAFLKLWNGNSAKYIHPSTDWSQGGPIIEREGICLYFNPEDADAFKWHAEDRNHALYLEGPTPLIAAMRCFVASRLGDEVDIPEELLT